MNANQMISTKTGATVRRSTSTCPACASGGFIGERPQGAKHSTLGGRSPRYSFGGFPLLLAHAGHVLVDLLTVAPVIVLIIWFAFITIRDRRRGEDDEEEGELPRT
jgi:hypothetical protein